MNPYDEQAQADEIRLILTSVELELSKAVQRFKPFNSAHEGFAILKEEVDELWVEVQAGELKRAREEALQVAAMALRFLLDVRTQNDMDNRREEW